MVWAYRELDVDLCFDTVIIGRESIVCRHLAFNTCFCGLLFIDYQCVILNSNGSLTNVVRQSVIKDAQLFVLVILFVCREVPHHAIASPT